MRRKERERFERQRAREIEDGEVTGELVFDEATELSKRCKNLAALNKLS